VILRVARLLLRLEKRRLERATLGPYVSTTSKRLDGVQVALEALQ
jgi:hypothetical protein